jgi:uncharacterized protein YecE (DUF72 family)
VDKRAQLSLFGGGGPDPAGPEAVVTPAQRELAARLPSSLYLGTSSWTFPGWTGIVFAGRPGKDKLVERGLEAYAKHPLLRTVGVDRSYYAPMTVDDWRGYARQLPGPFRTISKAWSEVTTAVFPDHPRLGERAGRINPRFLDPELALEVIARPYLDGMGAHAGPLVFELPPIPERMLPPEADFLRLLDALLGHMPRELPLAVELRTRQLLTPRYLDLLRRHRASHVLNFWTAMPTPGQQAALGADDTDGAVVLRLMLPPGRSYEQLKAAYDPFDRLVEPQPRMRAEVVEIVARAVQRGRSAFVIANNKAEGSAPLTLFAIAQLLSDELERRQDEG